MKDASRPSMHLETISCVCMMSPPSRRQSLPHCSTSSGRNLLATFDETQNRVTKPFVRTLRMVSSRGPTRFGATSSYCGSAIIVFRFRVKALTHNLQSSSPLACEGRYLGGFPSCLSIKLYKILICQSYDRSASCRSMLMYRFCRL